jgi:hypothetical protein
VTVGGSQQLRKFRRLYHLDGMSIGLAAECAGLALGEARLTAAEDAKNPPPPEAFEILSTPPAARGPEAQPQENDMGRTARTPTDAPPPSGPVSGEYHRPDAVGAFRIYDTQIKAKKAVISEKQGDLSEPYSQIKDTCNFPRKILDLIIHLEGQEDAKRDHMLLALSEGLRVRKLFMPRDLVTMADGDADGDVIPTGPAAVVSRPRLVAVDGPPQSDGTETDLADAAEAPAAKPKARGRLKAAPAADADPDPDAETAGDGDDEG